MAGFRNNDPSGELELYPGEGILHNQNADWYSSNFHKYVIPL